MVNPKGVNAWKSQLQMKYVPVVLTSFVNKCGDIGLSLLPVLLIELKLSTEDSAWVMGTAKSGYVVGTVIGGVLADWLGLKRTVVLSFVFSGLSLGLIPYSAAWFGATGLAVFSFLASFSGTLYKGPNRLLVVSLAGPGERQEAIGWLRTANNFGMIVGYGIGAIGRGIGLPLLFFFDAITSFGAAGFGLKYIPANPVLATKKPAAPAGSLATTSKWSWVWPFMGITLVLTGYNFLYDLFMVGGAARSKVLFGDAGVSFFSQMMLVNVVVCALMAIPVARALKNVRIAYLVGFLCLTGGLLWTVHCFETASRLGILLGAFVLTLGEIFLSAVGQLSLIHHSPDIKAANTLYGASLTVQYLGKVSAAALAFPWIVDGRNDFWGPLTVAAVVFVLILALLPQLNDEKQAKG